MRDWFRGTAAAAAGAAAAVAILLSGCAGDGAPEPTVPELTYAGAPSGEATPTGPEFTPTASPTETEPADDTAPSANPAVDDAVQYASIGGSELSGEWHGGCRTNTSVGVAGMTWRGSDLQAADGTIVADITVEISIHSTAADGTPHLDHFRVHGSLADGRAFDSNWAPYAQDGEVMGSSGSGVYSFHHTTPDIIDSFDLRVYCN